MDDKELARLAKVNLSAVLGKKQPTRADMITRSQRALEDMNNASEIVQTIHALFTELTVYEARACAKWMDDTLQGAMLIVPGEGDQMKYTVEQACLRPEEIKHDR